MAVGAFRVGTRKVPSRRMWATISSVRKTPCSIEVIPASIASLIPVAAMAWAAVRRPALRASSMAARISSKVIWGEPGSTPGVITPPVAMILITSAPALSCSRTALRASSGPSASRPSQCPCPPVMHTGRPAARMRGPSMSPSWMARRTAISTYSRPPRSRTVVTPARAVSRARSSALIAVSASGSSRSGRTGSASAPRQRCTWQLMSPGRSVCPARSTPVAARRPRVVHHRGDHARSPPPPSARARARSRCRR